MSREISLIVRIDLGVHGRLGPGKMLLLQSIEQHGSISAAGRAMNMSYRQAWDLVDQLNRAFTGLVVTSQAGGRSGGGAALTDFGRELVRCYAQITHDAERGSAASLDAIRAKLRPAGEAKAG